MGNRRYFIILAAFILAIILDAIIFVVILGVPYTLVPPTYHIGNTIMLTCAVAIAGDAVFKGGVLR